MCWLPPGGRKASALARVQPRRPPWLLQQARRRRGQRRPFAFGPRRDPIRCAVRRQRAGVRQREPPAAVPARRPPCAAAREGKGAQREAAPGAPPAPPRLPAPARRAVAAVQAAADYAARPGGGGGRRRKWRGGARRGAAGLPQRGPADRRAEVRPLALHRFTLTAGPLYSRPPACLPCSCCYRSLSNDPVFHQPAGLLLSMVSALPCGSCWIMSTK